MGAAAAAGEAPTCLVREALGSRRVGRVMHGSVALGVSARPAALLSSPPRSSSPLRCLQAPLFWILNVFRFGCLGFFSQPPSLFVPCQSPGSPLFLSAAAAVLPHSCFAFLHLLATLFFLLFFFFILLSSQPGRSLLAEWWSAAPEVRAALGRDAHTRGVWERHTRARVSRRCRRCFCCCCSTHQNTGGRKETSWAPRSSRCFQEDQLLSSLAAPSLLSAVLLAPGVAAALLLLFFLLLSLLLLLAQSVRDRGRLGHRGNGGTWRRGEALFSERQAEQERRRRDEAAAPSSICPQLRLRAD